MSERVLFSFTGNFAIEKSDVFDYFDSAGIEYDPDTAEPTMEDFEAAANWYATMGGNLEFSDISPC